MIHRLVILIHGLPEDIELVETTDYTDFFILFL